MSGDALREAIATEALSWRGVPFAFRGRTRAGVDCVGLIYAIYKASGIALELPHYSDQVSTAEVYASVSRYARRLRREDVRPGDLVLMSYSGQATHFGLMLERTVLYVSRRGRRVIEQSQERILPLCAAAYYRPLALEATIRAEEGGVFSSSS